MADERLEKYLEGLGKQQSIEEKEIKLFHNSSVDSLCELFEKCLSYREVFKIIDESVLWADQGIKYASQDVTDFSLQLKKYECERRFPLYAGVFLSLLINNSKESEFKVITYYLSKKLNCFGWNNNKNILLKGSIGNHLGQNMHSGKIIVEGNTGELVGDHMYDAEIHVNGNIQGIAYTTCMGEIYQNGVLVWPT